MTLAYYDPTVPITANAAAAQAAGAPSTAPVFTSTEKPDMIVASDFSRRVYGFVGGVQAWTRDYPGKWPRGVDVFEGLAYIANGTSIDVVNPKTGFLHTTISVPSAPGNINSIRVTKWNGSTWLTLAFDTSGSGSVRAYTMSSFTLTQYLSSSHSAQYPRCAFVDVGWIWVADTFGHRVYAIDLASGAMRPSQGAISVYYPNTVDFIPGSPDKIIVCAEHENRVFEWDYSPSTVFTMKKCAPVAPYNDMTKTKADMVSGEAATVDSGSTFTPKKSQCAIECSGSDTLYSPNSARLYGNDLLVADCDNQRVVMFRSGTLVAEITGFNNPVTAVLI